MKIAVGSDHAGFKRKVAIVEWLTSHGHEITDFGTYSEDSVDYPEFAHPVAEAVSTHDCDMGVLVCGSANGVAMAANKHKHIRAAVCWIAEIASLARQHNNANICCVPARFVSDEDAKSITEKFFSSEFEGGRHERRVNKIASH